MDFVYFNILWSLVAVPVLALLAWWDRRVRLRRWREAGQTGLPPRDGEAAWLFILALIVVALARPRWGQLRWEVPEPGRDVVLMIDLSLSMAAEDVAPNRLAGAVEAARSLLDRLGREPGDRVGVVAFAGRGAIRCPLTANLGAVSNVLEALRPGTIQPGGTDLGAGLDEALELLDDASAPEGGRSIVVLSDGEDHPGRWASRLERLRSQGVVVHTIAIGDRAEGHPIPVPNTRADPRTQPEPDPETDGYLTYQGEIVKTRCEDASLRQLALSTGGAFVPIGQTRADLAALYDREIAPLERAARIAHRHRSPERAERFQFALFLAVLGGVIGAWPRRRRPATAPARWRRRLRRLLLLPATALALATCLGAAERQDVENLDIINQEGIRAFNQKDFESALRAFERVERRTQSPTATYNVAATLFQLGRFEEARQRYQAARERARPSLALKIDYALGNTALAQRRLPAALKHYDGCLASTVPGPPYERIRGFAAENRAFAERLARLGVEELPAEAPSDAPSDPEGRQPADDNTDGDDRSSDANAEDDDRGGGDGADGSGGEDAPDASDRVELGRLGGGGGSDDSEADSPAKQLDEAIAAIRDARRRLILDTPPAASTRAARKIW